MTIKGGCHCGAIQWQAPVPTRLARCNCSYCDRTGAEWGYCKPDEFKLITTPKRLSAYQLGTYTAVHFHCGNCGCATHGTTPDYSTGKPDFEHPIVAYNVRMAHEFDRSALPVDLHDGRKY